MPGSREKIADQYNKLYFNCLNGRLLKESFYCFLIKAGLRLFNVQNSINFLQDGITNRNDYIVGVFITKRNFYEICTFLGDVKN